MLDWNDVKDLKSGAILYFEQRFDRWVQFVPIRVSNVSENGLELEGEDIKFLIAKDTFPVDNLYLEE